MGRLSGERGLKAVVGSLLIDRAERVRLGLLEAADESEVGVYWV